MKITPERLVLTKEHRRALGLLARGGARYGTQIAAMRELKAMGLCVAHDKGSHLKKGRWTWRPTQKGREVIAALDAAEKEGTT